MNYKHIIAELEKRKIETGKSWSDISTDINTSPSTLSKFLNNEDHDLKISTLKDILSYIDYDLEKVIENLLNNNSLNFEVPNVGKCTKNGQIRPLSHGDPLKYIRAYIWKDHKAVTCGFESFLNWYLLYKDTDENNTLGHNVYNQYSYIETKIKQRYICLLTKDQEYYNFTSPISGETIMEDVQYKDLTKIFPIDAVFKHINELWENQENI